ncbi:unnamed protein product [Rotaria sp. Silwood1]|nr:unnamed protein product [Rotaria sp. Silwood1]
MSSLVFINRLIMLYVGLFVVIMGLIGSVMQVFILMTVSYYRKTPCTFYFIIAAVHECGQFITAFGPLVIAAYLDIDITRISVVWCKLRFFFLASFCAIPLTCACLATIDQYLITSHHVWYRQWSNIKTAHRASLAIVIIWWLHGTLWLYYQDMSPTTGVCIYRTIPKVRRRFHNTFEYIHRYVGWTCLVILIIHVVFLQLDKFDSFNTKALFNIPVLILLAIVIIIFLPWICVRKVLVQYDQPSNDLTIITFPRALYPYGSTTRISLDGHEWHAFAIALTDSYADQHSILVAAVGDWTKDLAADYRSNKLPQHVWIRRIKGLGFMYSIHAYRKVLIVCTGSGIAPALPYIKDPLPTTHTHLLWIAKKHEQNYGEYVWKLVQKTHPHYTLHDTTVNGRPSPQLVENVFWRTSSEAVFVVSNEKFTIEVVNALWRKDIPCFGALFDS